MRELGGSLTSNNSKFQLKQTNNPKNHNNQKKKKKKGGGTNA